MAVFYYKGSSEKGGEVGVPSKAELETEQELSFLELLPRNFLESQEGQAEVIRWAISKLHRRVGSKQRRWTWQLLSFYCPPETDFSQANLPKPVKDFLQKELHRDPKKTRILIVTDVSQDQRNRGASLTIRVARKNAYSSVRVGGYPNSEDPVPFFTASRPHSQQSKIRKKLGKWKAENCRVPITDPDSLEKSKAAMRVLEFAYQQADRVFGESPRE